MPGLLIIAASVVAAVAATKFIDTPLRRNKWLEQKRRRAVSVIIAAVVIVAVPLSGWQAKVQADNTAAMADSARNNPGAAATVPGYINESDPDAQLLPTAAAMPDDWPVFEGGKCRTNGKELLNNCNNGITDGEKSIVVLGSSHAHVLNTPLLEMAGKNHWNLSSITKGYCPLGDDVATGIAEDCADFNKDTMAQVLAMKPDVVVTTSTRTNVLWEEPELLDDSWISAVETLSNAGIDVVAVRDTPRIPQNVPECLAERPTDFTGCGAKRMDLYSATSPTDDVDQALPGVSFLDFTDYFCDDTYCPAVVGNVIVYKDDNHPTRTFMESLTPYFEQEFMAATGWQAN